MHYDYLIIGQGLAGSLLAWQFIGAGQRVLVIDNNNPCAASRVAAGLINPVTGKRLVMEKNAVTYLETARACYQRLGEEFGEVFLHDKPMFRLFDNDKLQSVWRKRRELENYQAFIGDSLISNECGSPQDGFIQYQTAYLSTSLLLNRLRQWLIEQSALVTAQFDYQELQIVETIRWQAYSSDRVIFCEGARVVQNPWFKSLPMQAAQGEILTLHTRSKLPKWIINGGQWLLPLDDGLFKLGATYVWPTVDKPLSEKTSAEGKQTLLNALTRLCPGIEPPELIAHEVGIRPNSKDKRPLIGVHPNFPQLAVFNGFGSRGSMLIPYYAQHFVDALLNGTTLEPDVDIKRIMT